MFSSLKIIIIVTTIKLLDLIETEHNPTIVTSSRNKILYQATAVSIATIGKHIII